MMSFLVEFDAAALNWGPASSLSLLGEDGSCIRCLANGQLTKIIFVHAGQS